VSQSELELPIAESLLPPKQAAARWETAIHEAGHTVVAIFYEIPLVTIRIDSHGMRDKRFVDGLVRHDRKKLKPLLHSPARTRWISKFIVMSYAGFFAQLKANPSADDAGSVKDAEHIEHLLLNNFPSKRKHKDKPDSPQHPTQAEIERVYNARSLRLALVTERLVDKLYPIIVMVARTLIERRQMTGDEVVALAGPLIAKERTAWTKLARRGIA